MADEAYLKFIIVYRAYRLCGAIRFCFHVDAAQRVNGERRFSIAWRSAHIQTGNSHTAKAPNTFGDPPRPRRVENVAYHSNRGPKRA